MVKGKRDENKRNNGKEKRRERRNYENMPGNRDESKREGKRWVYMSSVANMTRRKDSLLMPILRLPAHTYVSRTTTHYCCCPLSSAVVKSFRDFCPTGFRSPPPHLGGASSAVKLLQEHNPGPSALQRFQPHQPAAIWDFCPTTILARPTRCVGGLSLPLGSGGGGTDPPLGPCIFPLVYPRRPFTPLGRGLYLDYVRPALSSVDSSLGRPPALPVTRS